MPSEDSVIVNEVRERAVAEIGSLLESKVEELHQAKFKHALGQLEKTHIIKQLKRDIAKLKTVAAEKAAAGNQE